MCLCITAAWWIESASGKPKKRSRALSDGILGEAINFNTEEIRAVGATMIKYVQRSADECKLRY
jgi:hypothetical protein